MKSKSTENRSPRTAAAGVSEAIRQRILSGAYSAHQYIREASIARELEVSRTPVREAFRELVSDGWLEAIPHHGCRVVSWTEDDAREVFEIRLMLEPMAVGAACGRVSDETMAQLRRYCRDMEALTEQVPEKPEARDELARLNLEFHQQLIVASGNRRLASLLDSLVRGSVIRRNYGNYRLNHLRRSMHHHAEILQAIEANDPQWAENLMRTHLLAARSLHIDGPGARDAQRTS